MNVRYVILLLLSLVLLAPSLASAASSSLSLLTAGQNITTAGNYTVSIPVINGTEGLTGLNYYWVNATMSVVGPSAVSVTAKARYQNGTTPLNAVSFSSAYHMTVSYRVPVNQSFTLTLDIPGIDPTVSFVPTNILHYLPITISNNQNGWIAATTPLALGVSSSGSVVGVNAIAYQAYETCNLNNIEYFYANGTIVPSWLEGNILNEQTANTLCTSPSSPNALSASANVLTWVAPQNKTVTVGQFNGVNSLVKVANSNSLQVANSFTINIWVYPTQLGVKTNDEVISKTQSNIAAPFDIYITTANAMSFFVGNGISPNYNSIVSGAGTVTAGIWADWAFTYNGVGIATYKNGVFQTSKANVINPVADTGQLMRIGSRNDNSGNFMGDIAGAQIYNTVLTSSQLLTLYYEGISGAPISTAGANNVFNMPLNGLIGSNTPDYSGFSNNGVPTSMTFPSISNPTWIGPSGSTGISNTLTIYEGWAGNVISTSNTLMNGVQTGEATQLSGNTLLDNGNVVFPFYQNFASNAINGALPANWQITSNTLITYNQNNVTVDENGIVYGSNALATLVYKGANTIFGSGAPFGTDFYGTLENPTGSTSYTIANQMDYGFGQTSSPPSNGFTNLIGLLGGNGCGTCYKTYISPTSGAPTTGLPSPSIGVISLQYIATNFIASQNYKTTGFAYNTLLNTPNSANMLYYGWTTSGNSTLSNFAAGANIISVYWTKFRNPPPSGILPTTTFGSTTTPTGTATIGVSNVMIDGSQYLNLTAVVQGGDAPYTYNFLVFNSITNTILSSYQFNSISTTSYSDVFQVPISWASNVVGVNVVVTNAAGSTFNSLTTSVMTISPQFLSTGWTASNSVLDAGQTETLTSSVSGGTNSITVANFNTATVSYISIANSSALSIKNQITISAWVYPSNVANTGTITAKRNGVTNYANWMFYITGGNVYFRTYVNNNPEQTNSNTITSNKWYHVVGEYTGSKVIVYVNGVQSGSSFAASGTMNTVAANALIGTQYYTGIYNNGDFGGQIADVQIYNTSLSSTQISNLYQEGITGPPITFNGLAGWWLLNGASNTIGANVMDYSPNQNMGTPTNVIYSTSYNAFTYNDIVYASNGMIMTSLKTNVLPNTENGISATSNSFTFSTTDWAAGTYTANTIVTDSATTYNTVTNSISFTVYNALAFNSLTSVPTLPASLSLSQSLELIASVNSINAGEAPYTYNYILSNSITNTIIASYPISNTLTTNTIYIPMNSAWIGNTIEANVIITDSAGETVNSPYLATLTILSLASNSFTASNNPIDANQYQTLSAGWTIGSPSYTVTFTVYNAALSQVYNSVSTTSSLSATNTFQISPSWLSGNFEANVVIADQVGETASNIIYFNVYDPVVSITPLSQTIDNGQSAPMTANPSGGYGSYTYLWYSDAGCSISTGVTTSSYSPTPSSTTTYCVQITDSLGGTATATSTVTVNTTQNIYCVTPFYMFSPANGITYAWADTSNSGVFFTQAQGITNTLIYVNGSQSWNIAPNSIAGNYLNYNSNILWNFGASPNVWIQCVPASSKSSLTALAGLLNDNSNNKSDRMPYAEIFLGIAIFFLIIRIWKTQAANSWTVVFDSLAGIFIVFTLFFMVFPVNPVTTSNTLISQAGNANILVVSNSTTSLGPALSSGATSIIEMAMFILLALVVLILIFDIYAVYFGKKPKIPTTPGMP